LAEKFPGQRKKQDRKIAQLSLPDFSSIVYERKSKGSHGPLSPPLPTPMPILENIFTSFQSIFIIYAERYIQLTDGNFVGTIANACAFDRFFCH